MKLTAYYDNWAYWVDHWHTFWHDDAVRLDCNSREYRNITDIQSDVKEVREAAKELIKDLLK